MDIGDTTSPPPPSIFQLQLQQPKIQNGLLLKKMVMPKNKMVIGSKKGQKWKKRTKNEKNGTKNGKFYFS